MVVDALPVRNDWVAASGVGAENGVWAGVRPGTSSGAGAGTSTWTESRSELMD